MVSDDLRGPAELLERAQAQDIRARRALDLPQTLHDDLQVGRLDPRTPAGGLGAAAATLGADQRACLNSREHGVDELGLDGDRRGLRRERSESLDRAEDRAPSRSDGQMVELEAVREHPRKLALEGVEAGERVVANRDEDVHRQLGSGHQLGERVAECRIAAVVDEVLLHLVEEEVDLLVLGGGDLDRVGERAGLDRRGGGNRLRERRRRSLRPGSRRPRPAARPGAPAARVRRRPAGPSSCRPRSARTGR